MPSQHSFIHRDEAGWLFFSHIQVKLSVSASVTESLETADVSVSLH